MPVQPDQGMHRRAERDSADLPAAPGSDAGDGLDHGSQDLPGILLGISGTRLAQRVGDCLRRHGASIDAVGHRHRARGAHINADDDLSAIIHLDLRSGSPPDLARRPGPGSPRSPRWQVTGPQTGRSAVLTTSSRSLRRRRFRAEESALTASTCIRPFRRSLGRCRDLGGQVSGTVAVVDVDYGDAGCA
jgi:hypothetical protein